MVNVFKYTSTQHVLSDNVINVYIGKFTLFNIDEQ